MIRREQVERERRLDVAVERLDAALDEVVGTGGFAERKARLAAACGEGRVWLASALVKLRAALEPRLPTSLRSYDRPRRGCTVRSVRSGRLHSSARSLTAGHSFGDIPIARDQA